MSLDAAFPARAKSDFPGPGSGSRISAGEWRGPLPIAAGWRMWWLHFYFDSIPFVDFHDNKIGFIVVFLDFLELL